MGDFLFALIPFVEIEFIPVTGISQMQKENLFREAFHRHSLGQKIFKRVVFLHTHFNTEAYGFQSLDNLIHFTGSVEFKKDIDSHLKA